MIFIACFGQFSGKWFSHSCHMQHWATALQGAAGIPSHHRGGRVEPRPGGFQGGSPLFWWEVWSTWSQRGHSEVERESTKETLRGKEVFLFTYSSAECYIHCMLTVDTTVADISLGVFQLKLNRQKTYPIKFSQSTENMTLDCIALK